MKSHLMVMLLALGGSAAAQGDGHVLEVRLHGVQHERGSVRVGLYSEPRSFRKEEQAYALIDTAALAGTVSVRFEGLPAGSYAVMAYHDEDGNGALNRRFGMFPTEGYGLSRNPAVSGPPAFADSAFEVGGESAGPIDIQIRY